MAGQWYDSNNVVVGHAMLMVTPWTAVPAAQVADATPIFTPDDAAWSLWNSIGATNEGFKVNVETSTTQVTIEEQSTPVGETIESKSITIEAALAESTLESMRYSWGGSAITTVAGPPAKKTMTLTDVQTYYTVTLETRNFAGKARRLYIPKVSITGSGEVSFRRAADKQMFQVRVASLCKPTDIQIVDFT
jgi:hypothetical protein